jgi:hypothetical protein
VQGSVVNTNTQDHRKHAEERMFDSLLEIARGQGRSSCCSLKALTFEVSFQVQGKREPKNLICLRLPIFRFVEHSNWWMYIDASLIVVSTLCLGFSFATFPGYPRIEEFFDSEFGIAMFFAVAFTVQLFFIVLAHGMGQAWKSYWNRFDTFVVAITWLGYLIDFGPYSRGLRVVRLSRIAKLLGKHAGAMSKANRAATLGLHPDDNAISRIDADEYVTLRLEHTAGLLKKNLARYYSTTYALQSLIYVLAGVAACLAIYKYTVWMPLP